MAKTDKDSENLNVFNQVSYWIDQHHRFISTAFYLTGFGGICIALHSVRAFSRFTTINSIPKNLFARNVYLSGRVKSVTSRAEQVVLDVEHLPLIPISGSQPHKSLTLILASVKPAPENCPDQEFQRRLIQSKIRFSLLKRNESFITSIVIRRKNWLIHENLAISLISKGEATTATFDMDLLESKDYQNYYKKLLKAEEKAAKKRLGVWKDENEDQTSVWQRLQSKFKH